jgi:two-component system LytT family response regulator
MIRAIVIDDEKPSREVICNYLIEFCKEVEVVATASSIKTAYKAIRKFSPDLVFLDIEMPDGKGFDLLKMFDKIEFHIVFVTAYSEHAVKAFRCNAADYLLKPIKIDELQAAVEKVKKSGHINSESGRMGELLKNLMGSGNLQPTIVIPHIKGFEILKITELIMCKADGYCTIFYLTGNKRVISSKNLKHYEELLTEYNFIRVHHSYLVNLNHVSGYTKQGEIILTEDHKAFLGDAYKNYFNKLYINK